ncbi:MAG TPA: 4-alpha-glucanotransferase [Rhodanobacteraceae bacterium]|nr:4-alpha-glucanotransferase [Rhodanobacteraceae bacterium]
MNGSLLNELANRAGIEPGYRDTWGNHHDLSENTLHALLRAMGFSSGSHEEIVASITRLEARGAAAAPPEAAARAWRPAALEHDGRRWGLSVQLYAIRTERTWGIGDFSALAELMRGAAALGACAVGVNPIHALFPTRPSHASPYSPSSRRFLNTFYIDVEAIEDFVTCESARDLVEAAGFQARLREVREGSRVRYREVADLKYTVLSRLYDAFRRQCLGLAGHPRARAFREFQRREGPALRQFATFHALGETRTEIDWRDWPPEYTDPDSEAVAAFATGNAAAVEFHEYLQWQASLQLDRVNDAARECGMSIGLYADLAVGADPTGAESWSGQAFLASGATIGAPPDPLNLFGQNWGLPPLDPFALADAGYAPLSELWRSNMRGGALRIDHILGLVRLFWIPAGAPAADGAYVRYPWRELLGLLAAESRRSRCMVIGEDLGTVPEGLREAMHDTGLLSYRLLYFEQHDGRFRQPRDYPALALVAAGTHDLPSLAMWWSGEDIDLRERLGLWPNDAMREAELDQRRHARAALMDALRREELRGGDVPIDAPVEAIHAFLARTPCKLLMVQLEDVLDLAVQVNLPGTVDEHPNWRQRLPCTIAEALAHPRMRRIAALLEESGRSDRSDDRSRGTGALL